MKIIEGLKKLIPKRFFNKNKQSHKNLCDLALLLINQENKQCLNKPIDMDDEQWRSLLNEISFGFRATKEDLILKSPTRARRRQQKIDRAFELFKVYIKHL